MNTTDAMGQFIADNRIDIDLRVLDYLQEVFVYSKNANPVDLNFEIDCYLAHTIVKTITQFILLNFEDKLGLDTVERDLEFVVIDAVSEGIKNRIPQIKKDVFEILRNLP
jgi:hypothetical protein